MRGIKCSKRFVPKREHIVNPYCRKEKHKSAQIDDFMDNLPYRTTFNRGLASKY